MTLDEIRAAVAAHDAAVKHVLGVWRAINDTGATDAFPVLHDDWGEFPNEDDAVGLVVDDDETVIVYWREEPDRYDHGGGHIRELVIDGDLIAMSAAGIAAFAKERIRELEEQRKTERMRQEARRRVEAEARAKAKEEHDRAEYERLKVKYGS